MSDHTHAAHDDHGLSHVMPVWILIATFLALIALTALTVGSSYFKLGEFDLLVAMVIATIKAVLVAVYFMHMRYEKVMNTLFVVFSLAFVALFIGMCLSDTDAYQPEIQAATDAAAK